MIVRTGLLAVLTSLLMMTSPAVAEPNPPVKPGQLVRNPDWARKPTAAEILRHHPQEARRQRISGRATIACQVALSGRLENCSVQDEAPGGLGFGAAALAVAEYARMKPMTVDGEPRGGANITLPMRFALP